MRKCACFGPETGSIRYKLYARAKRSQISSQYQLVPREAEILLFPNRRLMTLIDGFALP